MDFLQSFLNFSKSNAFGEHLIKMQFILHKIFFRMSILLSSKILWMFFNLCLKMTLLRFQFIIVTHDKLMTVRQFLRNFPWFWSIFGNKITTILALPTSEVGGKVSGVITVLEVLITKLYLYIYLFMYKNGRYRLQFWLDFHEMHMIDAGPLIGEPYHFWKQSTQ